MSKFNIKLHTLCAFNTKHHFSAKIHMPAIKKCIIEQLKKTPAKKMRKITIAGFRKLGPQNFFPFFFNYLTIGINVQRIMHIPIGKLSITDEKMEESDKRPAFGNRHLNNESEIFKHNAW